MNARCQSCLVVLALIVLWFSVPDAVLAQDEPRPPCAGATPSPSHAPVGAPPAVGVWTKEDAVRWTPPACVAWPRSQRYPTIVALAGTFRHDGSEDDLLARFGAVSKMRGLLYWSVTDKRWRVLINAAAAVEGANAKRHRPDFSSGELSAGGDLYYAQDDSRSSGTVAYRMRVVERAPNRIVIHTENVDRVRAMFITLFPPGSLQATYFLERLAPSVWGLYGISGTGEDASRLAGDHEASYVNRAVALYRHFIGAPGDSAPPAAP